MLEWFSRPESLWILCTAIVSALYLRRCIRDGFLATQFYLAYFLVFHLLMLVIYLEVWTDLLQLGMLDYLSNELSGSNLSVTVATAFCLSQLFVMVGIELWGLSHTRARARQRLTIVQWQLIPIGFRRGEPAMLITACKVALVIISVYTLAQFAMTASPAKWLSYYASSVDEFEKVAIRRSATLGIYPYHLALNTVIPMLSFWAYAVSRASASHRLRSAARWLVCAVLLAKLGQFNKTGPVIYAIQFLIVFLACRVSVFQLGPKHLLIAVATTLLVGTIAFGVNTFESVDVGLISVFERLFMIPNETVFEYFSVIPQQIPYKLGTGLVSFLAPLFATSELELMPTFWQVGAAVRGGEGNVSNAIFISDAWAEFSWVGIVLFSVIAGWTLKWYDGEALRDGKSGAGIALAVSGYGAAFTLTGSSYLTTLLTGGMVVNVLFVHYLRRLCRRARVTSGLEAA